jgi:NitT/TauT family transport system ATP-binding protein
VAVLRCRGISKRFESENGPVVAIEKVDLDLAEGEFLCVLGPSGCGKSTLLRLVAGLVHPTEGLIEFLPRGGFPTERSRCAMVFQDHGLFPWMTVLDNTGFGLKMQGVPRKERDARSEIALEQVGISGFGNNYPHELSMGMRQRVALARAFVSSPEILLMDEPFASLDAQSRAILQRDLRSWQECRGTPVLFITHDISESLVLADRILVLSARPARVLANIPLPFHRSHSPADGFDPDLGTIGREIWEILGQEDCRVPQGVPA